MKLVLKMVVVLTVITMVSAALLSTINQWAQPRIEAHAEESRRKAIFALVPGTESFEELATYENDKSIYICRDENEEITGFTFEAAGTGYQGEIKLMAGLKPDRKHLSGVEVLAQVETPGLGGRINEHNPDPEDKNEYLFLNWFENLDVEPKIDVIKDRTPEQDNQVQAIAGATISSEAVVGILNRALERVRPLIEEKVPQVADNNE